MSVMMMFAHTNVHIILGWEDSEIIVVRIIYRSTRFV